jgi:hypothetical protein
MFCLNATGSKVLELIEAGANEEQIVNQVCAAYGSDIETVRVDVRDFLEALSQNEILQRCRPTEKSETGATHGTDAT